MLSQSVGRWWQGRGSDDDAVGDPDPFDPVDAHMCRVPLPAGEVGFRSPALLRLGGGRAGSLEQSMTGGTSCSWVPSWSLAPRATSTLLIITGPRCAPPRGWRTPPRTPPSAAMQVR